VFLVGDWCSSVVERADGSRYALLPSPYDEPSAYMAAARQCEDYYFRLVDRIGAHLARLLDREFVSREWRILLRVWLNSIIQHLFDRRLHLQSAARSLGSFECSLLDPASFQVPEQTASPDALADDDWYNLQLASLIWPHLHIQGTVHWLRRTDPPPVNPRSTTASLLRLRSMASALRRVRQLARGSARASGVLTQLAGFNDQDLQALSKRTGWQAVSEPKPLSWARWPPDRARRASFAELPANDDFEALVFSSVPHLLPVTLLEAFEPTRKAAIDHYGAEPKHVVTTYAAYGNDVAVHYLAHCAGHGRRVCSAQHGGGYGQLAFTSIETIEIHESDAFFTWGWISDDCPRKTVALPSPRLSRLRDSHRDRTGLLIYATVIGARYLIRYQTRSLPARWSVFLDQLLTFKGLLPENIQQRLRFRPPVDNYGHARDRLRQLGATLPTIGGGELVEHLASCRLAVVDHASTSFIEALVMNVPLVLFWDPVAWPMRPSADPYFQRLRDCGILHDSLQSAAMKVAEVFDDPARWWSSVEVQSARIAFIDHYGLSSATWLDEWAAALGGCDSSETWP